MCASCFVMETDGERLAEGDACSSGLQKNARLSRRCGRKSKAVQSNDIYFHNVSFCRNTTVRHIFRCDLSSPMSGSFLHLVVELLFHTLPEPIPMGQIVGQGVHFIRRRAGFVSCSQASQPSPHFCRHHLISLHVSACLVIQWSSR